MIEAVVWVIVDLVFFQVGKWFIYAATLGKCNPELGDKPINSNLVSLVGFVVFVLLCFVLVVFN